MNFIVVVYCAQSIIIGIFWIFTILCYGRIYKRTGDGGGYEEYANVGQMERLGWAGFFLLHYGMFHVIYISWMLRESFLPHLNRIGGNLEEIESVSYDFPILTFLIFTGIFFFDRFISFLREREKYARSQANVAKLTYFPYARIIPMHAAFFAGASLQEGNITPQSALVFFLVLKTAADVFMHIVQKKGFADADETRIDDSAPRIAGTPDGPVLLMPEGQRISVADKPEFIEKFRNVAGFPKDIRLKVCESLLGVAAPAQKHKPPELEQIKCRCTQTDFIEGDSVQKYADNHLEWLQTSEDGLTVRYTCPDTQKIWVMVAGTLKAEQPKADDALCRCNQIDRLDGEQARKYAKEHLKAVETDGGWRTTYICPYTEKRWLLDYTKITNDNLEQYARLRALPAPD